MKTDLLVAMIVTLVVSPLAQAAEPDTSAAAAIYQQQIKPLLKARCVACHGALKQEASLRLDTVAFMRKGGDSGDIIPSLLLERVSADESERMPPEGAPLTAEEIDGIRHWIRLGAAAPEGEAPEESPRNHWAFQRPFATEIPQGVHPIDHLLEKKRAGRLPVAPPATSLRILRRATFGLTGLPPTPQQIEVFRERQTGSPEFQQQYKQLVTELLNSPQHGERWGRHWMDIWRYTDWYGLGAQLRNSQKHIWHWRDWIVESLNDDVGYDEMVRLMLAADELRPDDMDSMRATGFLARNYYLFNRTTWLDSTIEHTSKALLGLTMNCAKCHDHKYDPLSQREYYQMRAVFEPHQVRLDPIDGALDLEQNGIPRVFDAHPDAPTYLHIRGDEKQPDTENRIEPKMPAIFETPSDASANRLPWNPTPLTLPATAYQPQLRPGFQKTKVQAATQELARATDALRQAEAIVAAMKSADRREVNTTPASPLEGDVVFRDDFNALNKRHWQVLGPWKALPKGAVTQQAVGAERRSLTLSEPHDRDFAAVLKFKTLGGQMWKSVGIAFDVGADHEVMIYMSAHAPGPKLQVSYKAPQQAYPADGVVNRKVSLDTPYELAIAVQDKRVNVWIDGKFVLAYQLPIERKPGKVALIAFDAVVEFDSFRLQNLPVNAALKKSGKAPASPKSIIHQRDLAAANHRIAQANLSKIGAVFSAASTDPDHPSYGMRAEQAAAAQADHQWAIATRDLLVAEHALAAPNLHGDKRKAAETKLANAKKAFAAAEARAKAPGREFQLEQAGLKALEGPDEKDASRRAAFPKISTGRRTALAQWITDRNNPLTARVAVNHIWMRHFGEPLVSTVTDFGRRAPEPAQQALLDHLAVDLMEHNWSMKRLHRLIVTSAAYQRASSADAAVIEGDPDNSRWTRRRPVRLESEAIRDGLLHLASKLDLTMGGAPVKPSGQVTYRRSIYFRHSRDDQHRFLNMFDHADILRCYRRQESVVPQQALALANSKLALQMSQAISQLLDQRYEDELTFIEHAFLQLHCHPPSSEEQQACREMLAETRKLLRKDGKHTDAAIRARSRHNLIHALINHNDFVTIR